MNDEFDWETKAAFEETAKQYTRSDFEEFGNSLNQPNEDEINLIRDVVLIAGTFYRKNTYLDQKVVAGKETLRQIKKTEAAARKLINCLDELAGNPNARNTLKSITQNRQMREKRFKRNTWAGQQLVDNMFGSDDTIKSTPYQAVINNLVGLERTAGRANKETLSFVKIDRPEAIKIWVADMAFFWLRNSGEFVPTGHYYKEVGDYSSKPLSILVSLLQKIDPKASTRAILDAVRSVKQRVDEDVAHELMAEFAISAILMPSLIKTDSLDASVGKWAEYMGLPPETVKQMWEFSKHPPETDPSLTNEEQMQQIAEAIHGKFSDR